MPILAIVLAITAWVFWDGQRLIRADAVSLGARRQVGLWVSGALALPTQGDWEAARDDLTSALTITPDSPGLQEQAGDLFMVAGRRDWANEALRVAHFKQAESYYRQAISLRPTDPRTWASLAAALQGQGQTGAPMHQAWAKAVALGPNEGHVQPILMETALATWHTASPAMQEWVSNFFDNANESQQKAINKMADRYGLQFESDNQKAPTGGDSASSVTK